MTEVDLEKSLKMLEDMVWDDKIVVGFNEEDDSDDDDESCNTQNGDLQTEVPSPTIEEAETPDKLICELQQLNSIKAPHSTCGPETDVDHEIVPIVPSDVVTKSSSRDASIIITGKMLNEWVGSNSSVESNFKEDEHE